jgi:hypothetical protein
MARDFFVAASLHQQMEHLLVTRRYLGVIKVNSLALRVLLRFSLRVAIHTQSLAQASPNLRSTTIPFDCRLLRLYLRHFFTISQMVFIYFFHPGQIGIPPKNALFFFRFIPPTLALQYC